MKFFYFSLYEKRTPFSIYMMAFVFHTVAVIQSRGAEQEVKINDEERIGKADWGAPCEIPPAVPRVTAVRLDAVGDSLNTVFRSVSQVYVAR